MDSLNVGLCGLGTVGQGVLELLERNAVELDRRSGRPIEIVRVASRTPKPNLDLGGAPFTTDVFDVVADPRVDVVVELIGGETAALELARRALAAGKDLVTGNKALIARNGAELLASALSHGRSIGFEAAVAGGIPIIKTLREGLAGNRIEWLAGIINGTSNYILSAMTHAGQDFATALADAQAAGYAEADPTFDIEGIDAAHKLAIMASLAFAAPLKLDAVYTEGITGITGEDIGYAHELGYRIKHLGLARRADGGVEVRVHPTLVPEGRLLAKVEGVMNAVVVNGNAVGSTLYYGPGAGAAPSASAIVADLVDIARGIGVPQEPNEAGLDLLPMDAVTTAYYLKIPAVDQPGVLARVATILSEEGISIEAVIQREHAIRADGSRPWVPIIILTHPVREAGMNRAIAAIEEMDEVVDRITRIRVENLDAHA